ncbi:ankyrin-2-like isoform X11 [Centruroides vittatus]|uniref:ankyrin-2-like isoform X11 n=1 Tax=Centruroides vittatus TaxID=120091 RepID=UPI00350EFFC9
MEEKGRRSRRDVLTDGNSSFLRAARAGNLDKVLEWLKGSIDINTSNANGLNALHLASKEGHINVVTELIKRGANVNAATKKGNTALHISSLAGKQEVVKILVQNGANVNVQSQNGFTPLYMAAQENHDDVLSFLLANGANQSLSTEDGFTPLAVALQQGHDKVVTILLENDTKGKVRLPALHIAAKKDDCKAATLLLQSDHNPDVTSKSGFTPLHIAAHYGNENIAMILLEKGADVNFTAKHQITPLHVAAKWGKSNMVALLLEKGAKIGASTRDGLTPLHCAARSGHETVVDQLLENGAPISAKTKNGLAPLHMSSQGDHVDSARILLYHKAPVDDVTVDYLTALHVAAHCGHVNVAKLLLDRNADPNARALNGFTPLHIACKKNRIKVVELLLKHGASIEATTESGLTPLHVASFMGCMNIVIFLLQNGANPDVPTVRGETPLHLAARANQTDIIRILLRNGAHVDAPAREEQTPLHIAARLGNVDIVSLLLQHGAAVDATTKDMYTALHVAAKEGQEEVASVLLDHGASLTAATKKGFTPLHMAAKYGNIKVARLLLHKDAPVDAQGKNGVTPLHVAAHYDHVNVALLLLDKGASPHATAKNGYTPLHIASKKNQMDISTTLLEYGAKANTESKAGFTSLHLAAQEGHTDMATLLIEHNADVNARAKNGLTPLHLCAQEDRVNVAEILVKNGAEIDPQTKAEYSPLHVACHFGQINMVRFLLQHGANVNSTTSYGYTPLHQAAQQGHNLIINLLLENQASPNIVSTQGQTPLSIAQRLGYISVVETLKVVTETVVTTTTTTVIEEKYKVVAPETMQETFMSDSEDDGGEETMLGDQSYRYLTADEMKSLGDDSLPIDVTKDERPTESMMLMKESSAAPLTIEEDHLSPQHSQMIESALYGSYSPDNVDISLTSVAPISAGRLKWKTFLVSFMVDARGGAMRGCRHSGVRVIIPPRKASMPMRITCRYLRKEKLAHPPPLMEGEACASRILEVGPVGARFLGPVIIEVPHFASLRGKEREITILRSDNGETWRDHTLEASEEAVQEVLSDSFDGEELSALEDLNTNRITRILTTDFPQYFAIITRIRQEVHAIGPEGGMVTSTVVPQVQAIFPEGALTKKIKVGLQAQPIQPDLVTKLLGNSVAVSPIVTVEPRRRKFHKPITLTIPVPQAATKGMINQYSGDAPTLRLLCSITGSSKSGGSSKAQWEDVTGSTPLTLVNECISFTTTVSARFWLMDCRQVNEATKFATELYQEVIHVPFMGKFVIFAKRYDTLEAQLRVFCMTDDKEDKTLESQEHFTEIAKSRDVEVLQNKPQYLEFAGNLVPITKSGDQLFLTFHAFRENRLPFSIRIKDPLQEPMGRIAFMKEPKVGRGEPQPVPICNLNIALPEVCKMDNISELVTLEKKYCFVQETGLAKPELIHRADLRLSDIARELDGDWEILALQLDISETEINSIKSDYPDDDRQQALIMLRQWMQKSGPKATGNSLEKALRKIRRDDIVKQCMFNVELVTDAVEKAVAKVHLDQSGFDTFKEELGSSRDASLRREVSLDVSYDEQDLIKETVHMTENGAEIIEKQIVSDEFVKEPAQAAKITQDQREEKAVKYISSVTVETQEVIRENVVKQGATETATTIVMEGEEVSEHDVHDHTAKLVESETWASEMDTSQVSISSLPEDEKSEPTTATISSSIAAEPESAAAEASTEEKEHDLEKQVIPSDQDDSSSQDRTIEEQISEEKQVMEDLVASTLPSVTKETLELALTKRFDENLKTSVVQKKMISDEKVTDISISANKEDIYKITKEKEIISDERKQEEKSPQHVDRGLSPIAVYTAYPGDIRREGSEFFIKTYDAPTMQEPVTSYLGKSIKENIIRSKSISINEDTRPLEILLDRKILDMDEGRATSESKLTLVNPPITKTLDIHFKTESHIRITHRTKDEKEELSPEHISLPSDKNMVTEIENLPSSPVLQTDQASSPINIESPLKTEIIKSPSLTEEDISKGIGLQESFELSEEIYEKSEIATSPMSDHLLDTGVGTESPVTTETASSPFQFETKSVAVSPHDSAADISFPKEDSSTQTTLVDTVSAHTSPMDLSLSFQDALLDQQIQLGVADIESQDEIETPGTEILDDEELEDKFAQESLPETKEQALALKSEAISTQEKLKLMKQNDFERSKDVKLIQTYKFVTTQRKDVDSIDKSIKQETVLKCGKKVFTTFIKEEKVKTDWSEIEDKNVQSKTVEGATSQETEVSVVPEVQGRPSELQGICSTIEPGTVHRTREIDIAAGIEELDEAQMKQLTPEEILSFAEKRDFFQRLSQTSIILPPDFSSSTKLTMTKGVKLIDESDARQGEVVEEQVSFAERLKFFQTGAEDENGSKPSSITGDSSALSDEGTEAERSITEKEFAEDKISGLKEKSSSSSEFTSENQVLKAEIQLFLRTGSGGEAIEISKIKDYSGLRKEASQESYVSEEEKQEVLETNLATYAAEETQINEEWEIINDDEIREARETLHLHIDKDKGIEETWEVFSKQKQELKSVEISPQITSETEEKEIEKTITELTTVVETTEFIKEKLKDDLIKSETKDEMKVEETMKTKGDTTLIMQKETTDSVEEKVKEDLVKSETEDEIKLEEITKTEGDTTLIMQKETTESFEEKVKEDLIQSENKEDIKVEGDTTLIIQKEMFYPQEEIDISYTLESEPLVKTEIKEKEIKVSSSEEIEDVCGETETKETVTKTIVRNIEKTIIRTVTNIKSGSNLETVKVAETESCIDDNTSKDLNTSDEIKFKEPLSKEITVPEKEITTEISPQENLDVSTKRTIIIEKKLNSKSNVISLVEKEEKILDISEIEKELKRDSPEKQIITQTGDELMYDDSDKKHIDFIQDEQYEYEGKLIPEVHPEIPSDLTKEDIEIETDSEFKMMQPLKSEDISHETKDTELEAEEEILKSASEIMDSTVTSLPLSHDESEDTEDDQKKSEHMVFESDTATKDTTESESESKDSLSNISVMEKADTIHLQALELEEEAVSHKESDISQLEMTELTDSKHLINKEYEMMESLASAEAFPVAITSTVVTEGNEIATTDQSTVIVRKISTIVSKTENVILEREYKKVKSDKTYKERLFDTDTDYIYSEEEHVGIKLFPDKLEEQKESVKEKIIEDELNLEKEKQIINKDFKKSIREDPNCLDLTPKTTQFDERYYSPSEVSPAKEINVTTEISTDVGIKSEILKQTVDLLEKSDVYENEINAPTELKNADISETVVLDESKEISQKIGIQEIDSILIKDKTEHLKFENNLEKFEIENQIADDSKLECFEEKNQSLDVVSEKEQIKEYKIDDVSVFQKETFQSTSISSDYKTQHPNSSDYFSEGQTNGFSHSDDYQSYSPDDIPKADVLTRAEVSFPSALDTKESAYENVNKWMEKEMEIVKEMLKDRPDNMPSLENYESIIAFDGDLPTGDDELFKRSSPTVESFDDEAQVEKCDTDLILQMLNNVSCSEIELAEVRTEDEAPDIEEDISPAAEELCNSTLQEFIKEQTVNENFDQGANKEIPEKTTSAQFTSDIYEESELDKTKTKPTLDLYPQSSLEVEIGSHISDDISLDIDKNHVSCSENKIEVQQEKIPNTELLKCDTTSNVKTVLFPTALLKADAIHDSTSDTLTSSTVLSAKLADEASDNIYPQLNLSGKEEIKKESEDQFEVPMKKTEEKEIGIITTDKTTELLEEQTIDTYASPLVKEFQEEEKSEKFQKDKISDISISQSSKVEQYLESRTSEEYNIDLDTEILSKEEKDSSEVVKSLSEIEDKFIESLRVTEEIEIPEPIPDLTVKETTVEEVPEEKITEKQSITEILDSSDYEIKSEIVTITEQCSTKDIIHDAKFDDDSKKLKEEKAKIVEFIEPLSEIKKTEEIQYSKSLPSEVIDKTELLSDDGKKKSVEELIHSKSEMKETLIKETGATESTLLSYDVKTEISKLQEEESVIESIPDITIPESAPCITKQENFEDIKKQDEQKEETAVIDDIMPESTQHEFIDVSDLEDIEPELEIKAQPIVTTPVIERKLKTDRTQRKTHISVADVTEKYADTEVKHTEPIIFEPSDDDKESFGIECHHSTPDFRQMTDIDLEAILEEHAKEEQRRAASESIDTEEHDLTLLDKKEPEDLSVKSPIDIHSPISQSMPPISPPISLPKLDESECHSILSTDIDSCADIKTSHSKSESPLIPDVVDEKIEEQKLISENEYSDQEVFYAEPSSDITDAVQKTTDETSQSSIICEPESEAQIKYRTQMAFDNTAFMGIDNIDVGEAVNREMVRSPYEVVRMKFEDFEIGMTTEQSSVVPEEQVLSEEKISKLEIKEDKYESESVDKSLEIPSREEATKIAQEIIEEIRTEVAKSPLLQNASIKIPDEDDIKTDSQIFASDDKEIMPDMIQSDDGKLIPGEEIFPAEIETSTTKTDEIKPDDKIKELSYEKADETTFPTSKTFQLTKESMEIKESHIFITNGKIEAISSDVDLITDEYDNRQFPVSEEIDYTEDFHSQMSYIGKQDTSTKSVKETESFTSHANLNGPVAVSYIPEYDDETFTIEKIKETDVIDVTKDTFYDISQKSARQDIPESDLMHSENIENAFEESVSASDIKETEIFNEEEYIRTRISISDDQVDQEIKKILSDESQTEDDRLTDIIERPITPEPSDEILEEMLLPESEQLSKLATITQKTISISEEEICVKHTESEMIYPHQNVFSESETDEPTDITVNKFYETALTVDLESREGFPTESVFQQESAEIMEEAMDIGSDKCSDDIEETDNKTHFEYGVHFAAEPHYDEIPKYVESGYGDLYTHQEEDEEIFDEDLQESKNLIENNKQMFSDLDVLLGPKLYTKSGEHDDSSMSSLQEFERLEAEIATGRKLSQGSVDSLNGRPSISKSGEHDDVSMNSLTEFERLERECAEAERIESVAREEAARLSEIEEGHESQASETSQETLSGPEDMDSIDSDDYEKRLSEIDEIIRQAQTNVESFQVEPMPKQSLKSIRKTEIKSLSESLEKDIRPIDQIPSPTPKEQDSDSLDGNLNNIVLMQKETKELDICITELTPAKSSLTVESHDANEDSLNEDQDNSLEHDSLHEVKDHEQDSLKEDKTGDVDSLQEDQKILMQDSLYEEKDLDEDSLRESLELPKDELDVSQLSDKGIDTVEFDDSLHEECIASSKYLEHEPKFIPSLISSTDSLEPSSSTAATHATYQFETDSIMSSSLNSIQTSGEETLMASSTDSLDPNRMMQAYRNVVDSQLRRDTQDMYLDYEGNVQSAPDQTKSYMDKEGNIHPVSEIVKKLDVTNQTCVLNVSEEDQNIIDSIEESKTIKSLKDDTTSSKEYVSLDTTRIQSNVVTKDLSLTLTKDDVQDEEIDEEGNIIEKGKSPDVMHDSDEDDKDQTSISEDSLQKQVEDRFSDTKVISSRKGGEQVEEIKTVDELGNIRIIRRIRHIVTVQRDELSNPDIEKSEQAEPEVEETRTTDDKGNVKIIRRSRRIIKMPDSQSSDIDKHLQEFVQKSSVSDDSQITSPDVSQTDSLQEKYFQDPRCESPITRDMLSGRESVASIRSDFSDADSEIREIKTTDEKGNIIIRRIRRIVTPLPPDSNPSSGRESPYLKEPSETVEERRTVDEKGNVIIKRIRRIVKVQTKDTSETSPIPLVDNEELAKSDTACEESEPEECKFVDEDGNIKHIRRIKKIIKIPQTSNDEEALINDLLQKSEISDSISESSETFYKSDSKLINHVDHGGEETEKHLVQVKKSSSDDTQEPSIEEKFKDFLKKSIAQDSKDEKHEERIIDDKGNVVIIRTVKTSKVSEPKIHSQKFTGPDAEKQSLEFIKSFDTLHSTSQLQQYEATDGEGNIVRVTQEISAQPHVHSVSFSGESYEQDMESYMKNYEEKMHSSEPGSSPSISKSPTSVSNINVPYSTMKTTTHSVDESPIHTLSGTVSSSDTLPIHHEETKLMSEEIDNKELVQSYDSDDAIDSEEDEIIDYLKRGTSSFKEVEPPSDSKNGYSEESAKQL